MLRRITGRNLATLAVLMVTIGATMLFATEPVVAQVAAGSVDSSFSAPALGGTVQAIAVQADGKIIVGIWVSATSAFVKRLNTDGTIDTTFAQRYLSFAVISVAIQGDGKIIIGGTFPGNVRRLNTNGTNDDTFGAGVGYPVWAIAVRADQKIYLGGDNSTFARYLSNGERDQTWYSSGFDDDGSVYSVALQADGKVIVGGNFTMSFLDRPSPRPAPLVNIARYNADSTIDSTFAKPTLDGAVRALAIQADGRIVVGGEFTGRIKRLAANGTVDTSLGVPALDGAVRAVVIQADGKIVIAGEFTGGIKRLYSVAPSSGVGGTISGGGGGNGVWIVVIAAAAVGIAAAGTAVTRRRKHAAA